MVRSHGVVGGPKCKRMRLPVLKVQRETATFGRDASSETSFAELPESEGEGQRCVGCSPEDHRAIGHGRG